MLLSRLTEHGFAELLRQAAVKSVVRLLYNDALRRWIVRAVEPRLPGWFAEYASPESGRIVAEESALALAILDSTSRLLERRAISRQCSELLGFIWARAFLGAGRSRLRNSFRQKMGDGPPSFLVVAPTGACNLNCLNCYAGALSISEAMPFGRLERLVQEARSSWGIKGLAFSGGEPLLYRSEGKGIMDIAELHRDLPFLVFTNGTLVDPAMAARFASAGNISPALSVEGLRETTDARRGPGTFDAVVRALTYLREAGVPTGLSITVTRYNCEEVFSDEFLDFFFSENPAFYAIIFQYMPQGRDPDLSLMPTPEQRLWMWRRSWEIIEKRRIFLFDFWNHGTLIGGCMAAGRERGYLYVDWNGNVAPCVFAPYVAGNIHEAFGRDDGLDGIWDSPFLAEIRAWQRRHRSGDEGGVCSSDGGRMVCACPVRDHYGDFSRMVLKHAAEPMSSGAGPCLTNPGLAEDMAQYGADFAALGGPVLDSEYG